ncbi:MAG: hypothetical protein HN655_05475 [Candidatus Marinimicrobia bacterium]|nr:hypothetical protein [Candidatus Neomarinimicrobiota bacterium]
MNSDQTNFGTSPKSGKNKLSVLAIVWSKKIPKFTETKILIASVNKAGL